MFLKIKCHIAFLVNPPKPGDVYTGDAFDFVLMSEMEKCLHRMKTLQGNPLFSTSVGDDTYKLIVESDSMPYFRCRAEVLGMNVNTHQLQWLVRSQPRRISKHKFRQMLVDGLIRKK